MAERRETNDGNTVRELEVEPVQEAAAVQPMSEAERLKQKQAALLVESEDLRAMRRNDEQANLVKAHDEGIQSAQTAYPVPDGTPFEQLSAAEVINWNLRRTSIDQANRAYHLAVKRLMTERAAEDQFLAQSRVPAQS